MRYLVGEYLQGYIDLQFFTLLYISLIRAVKEAFIFLYI